MILADFIKYLKEINIDENEVKELMDIYGNNIPEMVKKFVVSSKEEHFFDDGGRLLSYYEICHSDDEYETNFVPESIIPLIDMGDNDFIVYDLNDALWKKYNIVDCLAFDEATEIVNLIEQIY